MQGILYFLNLAELEYKNLNNLTCKPNENVIKSYFQTNILILNCLFLRYILQIGKYTQVSSS